MDENVHVISWQEMVYISKAVILASIFDIRLKDS